MSEERRGIARFVEYDEKLAKTLLLNRALYRWLLEFFRNCMVVAALFYLAHKSENWLVMAVAGLAYFALAAYCYTYIEVWTLRTDFLGNTRARVNISILVGALILNLILAGIGLGLYIAINKIVEAQGR